MGSGVTNCLAVLLGLATLVSGVALKKTETDDARVLRLWRHGFKSGKALQPLLDAWTGERPCTKQWLGIGCTLVSGEKRVTAVHIDVSWFALQEGELLFETTILGILADLPLKNFQNHWPSRTPVLSHIRWRPRHLAGRLCEEEHRHGRMVIRWCQLEGRLPAHTQLPPNLETLDLSANKFTGELLPGWANLKQLKVVRLADNKLRGSLPQPTWMPQNIVIYDVRHNKLTGGIPDWSSLGALREIYLEQNQLAGPLPAELPPHLEDLYVGSNVIVGSLPKWTANPALLRVDLSGNKLTGSVPDYAALGSLITLKLDNNHLSGQLGTGFPPSLYYLWLNNNALTGSVPDLTNLENLVDLNLDVNELSITPPAAFLPQNLKTLRMRSNSLQGPMPDYSSVPQLSLLDMSHNQLSGSLPAAALLPPKTASLDLSANRFAGPLPADWAGLRRMQILSLQYNEGLSGQIPGDWGEQSSFIRKSKFLVLKPDTGLCGAIPDLLLHHVFKYEPSTQQLTELEDLPSCPTTEAAPK